MAKSRANTANNTTAEMDARLEAEFVAILKTIKPKDRRLALAALQRIHKVRRSHGLRVA